MRNLKNLCDLLNQRFICGFVYDIKIDAILYFSSRFTIEINIHEKTRQYVLHLLEGDYVCVRCDNDEAVLFDINNFFHNQKH